MIAGPTSLNASGRVLKTVRYEIADDPEKLTHGTSEPVTVRRYSVPVAVQFRVAVVRRGPMVRDGLQNCCAGEPSIFGTIARRSEYAYVPLFAVAYEPFELLLPSRGNAITV